MSELRNPYKGRSPRAWINLSLRTPHDVIKPVELVIDTGSPMGLILSPDVFDECMLEERAARRSNFGELPGGWFKLIMIDTGIVELVEGYRSQAVRKMVKKSHPDFDGLLGLPILRLGEFGGDARSFWFRYPASNPIQP